MPGAVVATDKLPQFAIAADIKMRRYGQALYAFEIGVSVPVQLIGKQLLNLAAHVLARWQADAMQYDQINLC